MPRALVDEKVLLFTELNGRAASGAGRTTECAQQPNWAPFLPRLGPSQRPCRDQHKGRFFFYFFLGLFGVCVCVCVVRPCPLV